MADRGKLARIHRVRTLQLTLTQAEESRAHQRVANETELARRIGHLAAAVAPAATTDAGVSLAAAAFYRERLHQSAAAADARVRAAETGMDSAREATRAAKRDQSAVEKLIQRADAAETIKAIRALAEAPPQAKKRHDPC